MTLPDDAQGAPDHPRATDTDSGWFRTVNATSMMPTTNKTRGACGSASEIGGGTRAVLDGEGVRGNAAGGRSGSRRLQDGRALLAEGLGRGGAATEGSTTGAPALARRTGGDLPGLGEEGVTHLDRRPPGAVRLHGVPGGSA